MKKILVISAFLASSFISQVDSKAISITWDTTYDTNGFWDAPKLDVLNLVSSTFSNVSINRGAIIPGGVNEWDWSFWNPSDTSELIELNNPSIGAGELRIFVGADSTLGPTTLGIGGNVGFGGSGTQSWIDSLIDTNTSSHYKPFAGGLSINPTFDWYAGLADAVPFGTWDLYTVVLHEVGHVLGIGLYGFVDVWDNYVNTVDKTWTGPNAISSFGGPIPLENDFVHWKSGTQQDGQTLVMVPTIPSGTRRHWTDAEYAVLADMGYIVIPEPSATTLIISAAFFLFLVRRRKSLY